jgi:hypothetical protein
MLCHSLFLSLLPKFHGVVQPLQTCSTFEFVCAHGCFPVYVCLLNLSSMYERKVMTFVFLSLIYFTEHNLFHPPTQEVFLYSLGNKKQHPQSLFFSAGVHANIK